MKKIKGGFTIWAKKTLKSEIWTKKPAAWFKIWFYVVNRVDYDDEGENGKGNGYFNLTQERRQIGIDISEDQIKKFISFAKARTMVSTTRSTRGMMIKVNLYADFQDIKNYSSTTESTTESTREAREKHPDNKKKIKEKNTICAFDTFWKEYPRKISKNKAEESWNRLEVDDELCKKIILSIQDQKKSKEWKKDDGQFIPYPATWLNQKRWEDEITIKKEREFY